MPRIPSDQLPPPVYLVPVVGKAIPPLKLDPGRGVLTLGRNEECDLRLPPDADKVSRLHCRFVPVPGGWRVTDQDSRWGTFVNGVRVPPGSDLPLVEGDLIRVSPWTFRVSLTERVRGPITADDSGVTMVRTVTGGGPLGEETLSLLLEVTSALHAARTEKELWSLVLDAATRGTGLGNAAIVRPADAEGRLEVLDSRFLAGGEPSFSRSLINHALQGHVAEIASGDNMSQSIVRLQISSAMCVPLTAGQDVEAVLYLDSRGTVGGLRPVGSAFGVALGRMAGLAMSSLKRADIERRQARIESELQAAAAAQKWIMPKRQTRTPTYTVLGESRAGRYVGGDFFDVIDLGDGRLAVALADVSGKGVEASVLMTATQGFLHAALTGTADVGKAMKSVSAFVEPRRPADRFVTMWVGIIDAAAGEVTYVDAGHSYAAVKRASGRIDHLNEGGCAPIGVASPDDIVPVVASISAGDELMVVSDGIVEQFGPKTAADGSVSSEQFGMDGVCRALSATPFVGDAVEATFASLIQHAGTDRFGDDATVVLVRFGG